MAPLIRKIPGHIPKLWDRNVIFFANLLSLFFGNEQETQKLRKEVGSLESYGSRMVPIINLLYSNQPNLLVLEKKPSIALLRYFQSDLKLTVPEVKVMTHDSYETFKTDEYKSNSDAQWHLRYFQDHPAQYFDGYVTDDAIAKFAEETSKNIIGTVAGSKSGNNKYLLHKYLDHVGLPVFDTYIAENVKSAMQGLQGFKASGYKHAVIKSQIGASGIGIEKIDLTSFSEKNIPEYLFFEGACLVQGWLSDDVKGVKYIGSPSVQMFLSDEEISLHDITEQILSVDSVHEGNIAPPEYLSKYKSVEEELLKQAEIAAQWLFQQEYRGTASVDFHIIERNGKLEIRICEINARVTGATYPSILARHFYPEGAWLMRNIRFSPAKQADAILENLKDNNLLFYPDSNKGVLPFNFNTKDDGNIAKGQFLFIGKKRMDVLNLLKEMQSLKSVQGDFDRD